MGPVLVFGHRNPDNDSICSAAAYAHLKNLIDPDNVYVPVRLGPAPRETEWVFERFGLELPEQIAHVRTRVRDVMTENPATVGSADTMLDAGRIMRERGVRGVPVVSEDGVLVGLVNERILAERYLSETDLLDFSDVPVTLGRLASAVEGELLVGDADALLSGDVRIGASEPDTMRRVIRSGDVIILGDRVRTQPIALESGAACLVIAGGMRPGDDVVKLASDLGAAIVVTCHSVYAAARLVGLAHAVGDFAESDPLAVSPDALLSEVVEDLLGGRHRSAVVVDEDRRPAGMLTRTDLARGGRRRVVLVDHNEVTQSAPGIEDAAVLEIVDHHRVGDIQTAGPIMFLNMPVGSTATIVAERYRDLGIDTPDAIAGVLLAAVLTDTVLLKSPTSTSTDRRVVERLSERLGLDPMTFGMELFRARSDGEAFSAEKVVTTDLKEFRAGDLRIGIAQYETVDSGPLLEHRSDIVAALEALRKRERYDLAVLMLTDIVREGSEIFAQGTVRVAERALGVTMGGDTSAWMPGVLSRKKQVAARLVEAAGA
jgi:manganese-dependent inorganic pyrophosphatase